MMVLYSALGWGDEGVKIELRGRAGCNVEVKATWKIEKPARQRCQ